MDIKTENLLYKIAHELLESVKDGANKIADCSKKEFYSETAEIYLKEMGRDLPVYEEQFETTKQLEEKKLQFNLLNGSNNAVNYKKILEFLSDTIGFKVIYQSLLGVSKKK